MTTVQMINLAVTIIAWTLGSVMFSKWMTASVAKKQMMFMCLWLLLLIVAALNFAAFLKGVQS